MGLVMCIIMVASQPNGVVIFESKEYRGKLIRYSSEVVVADFLDSFKAAKVDLGLNNGVQHLRSNDCRFL